MEITLTDVTSGYNLSKINHNFKILQDAINNRLVHRDGTNELEADLDFNSYKAINVGSIVVDGKDIIEEINNAYDSIEDFLITTDNLLREIEDILSGQLQDRNQGNGQYSTQLLEDITEGTVYTIPNGLQYIVGRNSLRISYQGVMCYPTYQYDEVGTFDEASNQIKFNITIPAYSHLNIWISGVGNIVQIKEDLEAAFAEYTNYATATKAEVEAMKSSVDASEANVTAINSSVQEAVVNLEGLNTASLEAATNAKTWAEGTDEEVVAIGGEHSSKTWSLLSKEYAEAAEQIKQQIGTPLNVQGRVDSVQSLPSSGNKNGDMYFVGPESSDDLSEYVWINNKWEFLGKLGVSVPDASESEKGIVKLATQNEITNRTSNNVVVASKLPTNIDWSKVNNKPSTVSGYGITDVYTKTEVDTKIDAKDSLPSQEGNSGKFLTTDGSVAKWEDIRSEIDNISTGLNGKAGTDLANINTDGKSVIANMAMPSNNAIDLTYNGHGTTYTATADGYVTIIGFGSSAPIGINVFNTDNILVCKNSCIGLVDSTSAMGCSVPISKGQRFQVFYYNGTILQFTFTYAQGSKP